MSNYSPVYWVAIAFAFAFLIIDIFDDGALWNYLTVACIVIAILVHPGGVWGTGSPSHRRTD